MKEWNRAGKAFLDRHGLTYDDAGNEVPVPVAPVENKGAVKKGDQKKGAGKKGAEPEMNKGKNAKKGKGKGK